MGDVCPLRRHGSATATEGIEVSEAFTLSDADAGDVLSVVRRRHVQHSDLQLHAYFRFTRTPGHVAASRFRSDVESASRVAVQQRRAADRRPELQLHANNMAAHFRSGAAKRRRQLEVLDDRPTGGLGERERVVVVVVVYGR